MRPERRRSACWAAATTTSSRLAIASSPPASSPAAARWCRPMRRDVPARPFQFLARNGIVAALADALGGGRGRRAQRRTQHGLLGGRPRQFPVMAFPGDVDRPKVAGCLALIRDGATLVRDARDVLAELGMCPGRAEPTSGNPARRRNRTGPPRSSGGWPDEPAGIDALLADAAPRRPPPSRASASCWRGHRHRSQRCAAAAAALSLPRFAGRTRLRRRLAKTVGVHFPHHRRRPAARALSGRRGRRRLPPPPRALPPPRRNRGARRRRRAARRPRWRSKASAILRALAPGDQLWLLERSRDRTRAAWKLAERLERLADRGHLAADVRDRRDVRCGARAHRARRLSLVALAADAAARVGARRSCWSNCTARRRSPAMSPTTTDDLLTLDGTRRSTFRARPASSTVWRRRRQSAFEAPRRPEFGDIATNVAFGLAKTARQAPRGRSPARSRSAR